jgi:hypothetical protein
MGARQRENAMRNDTLLRLSSIVFLLVGVLLTWLSRGPMLEVPLAILMLCGVLAGGLLYWLYGKFFRWYIRRC